MGDEGAKREAQEYLAAKLSEEGQSYDVQSNTKKQANDFQLWI
jgi:hypothetical protein